MRAWSCTFRVSAVNRDRLLSEIVAAAKVGELPSVPVMQHLVTATAESIETGKNFWTCLGLNGAHRKYQKAKRDLYLIVAASHIPVGGNFKKAQLLAIAIEEFRQKYWPYWRDVTEPPENFTPLYSSLFHAFQTGEPIPTKPENLSRVLSRTAARIS